MRDHDHRRRSDERAPPKPAPARAAPEAEALRLQRDAGNAATSSLVESLGKGPRPGEGENPLFGRLAVQRNGKDGGAPDAGVAAPARASQTVTVSPISAPKDLGRGGFEWPVWFSIGSAAGADGWVVQEIQYTVTGTKADGGAISDKIHYWEAWQLKKGKKTTVYQDEGLDTNDDVYTAPPWPAGSKGTAVAVGKVRFFEGALPADFKQNNPATYAGILFSSTSKPDFWSGSLTDHNLTSVWDDSGKTPKTSIKTVP